MEGCTIRPEARRVNRSRAGAHRVPAGVTLVELMLAMTATALIGLSVASMFYATAYATSSRKEARDVLVREKVVANHVNAAIRSSRAVLDHGDGHLILWLDDTVPNGAPDLSEIQRIEFDATAHELRSYRAPLDLDEADDVTFALTDDFDVVTGDYMGDASFPLTIWATNVVGLELTLDSADSLQVAMVGYRVDVLVGEMTDTLVGQAMLGNRER